MSIQNRIRKAESDFAIGDYENSLIQVLIAVAATSKKRYPKLSDRQAFETFLANDFGPSIGIIGGYIKIAYRGEMHTMEHILYKFLRCNLLHEAEAPPDIVFLPPESEVFINPQGDKLRLNYSLITQLINVIKVAPENKAVFTQPPA